MANIDRLTKRVKSIEKWIDENGDGETVSNYNFLLNSYRTEVNMHNRTQGEMDMLRNLLQEFLTANEMMEKWNEYIKEKDNAVQKQATEEVPTREEAEDGEEVGKKDLEGSETT